ncbi:lipase member M-like [Sarcoramphus papa]
MWLLLVALCLAQGLGSAVPCMGASHDNPEQFMDISQIIHFHGYRSEEHQVLTDDGYFLTVNRIPGGREEAGSRGGHSSPRGSPRQKEGCDWSPHCEEREQEEIMTQRAPAPGEGGPWWLLPQSKPPALGQGFLTAQGQGWTQVTCAVQHGLVLDGSNWVSSFPNSSLGFILADAGYDVWIGNSRGSSWSRRHLNFSVDQEEFWDFRLGEWMHLAFLAGYEEFNREKLLTQPGDLHSKQDTLKDSPSDRTLRTLHLLCLNPELGQLPHCYAALLWVPRDGQLQTPAQTSGLCWGKDPHGCASPMTAKTGEFKQFDYGEKNKEKYNQTSTPFYRIEDMMVPTALWSGGEDWVNPPPETQRLLPRITNVVHHEHFPDWNHWYHIWGLDAPQRLYRQMVALMEQNPRTVHVLPWDGEATRSHILRITGFCTRIVTLLSPP